MHTFPGISEEYLLEKQSLGEVYDLFELANETVTGNIRESDYLENEADEITSEEMGDAPAI
jgi:hypothetical protein